ncbi:50S ribosomal protein L6 [Phycisphaeraceae bacterium D3-23]
MSRVGRKPIDIVKGVTVKINGNEIAVNGPKGDLKINTRPEVKVTLDEDNKQVVVERTSETRLARAMHGTTRSLIQNMIVGVTEGYQKDLQIVGVGWGANLKGNKVELNLGYADTRVVEVPSHIDCEVKGQSIKISGADKQAVGQLAAKIRQHRKPEPYNGKGVMFVGERVLRKQGKAFGS